MGLSYDDDFGYNDYEKAISKICSLCKLICASKIKSVPGVFEIYLSDLRTKINFGREEDKKFALKEIKRLGLGISSKKLSKNKKEDELSVYEWQNKIKTFTKLNKKDEENLRSMQDKS